MRKILVLLQRWCLKKNQGPVCLSVKFDQERKKPLSSGSSLHINSDNSSCQTTKAIIESNWSHPIFRDKQSETERITSLLENSDPLSGLKFSTQKSAETFKYKPICTYTFKYSMWTYDTYPHMSNKAVFNSPPLLPLLSLYQISWPARRHMGWMRWLHKPDLACKSETDHHCNNGFPLIHFKKTLCYTPWMCQFYHT